MCYFFFLHQQLLLWSWLMTRLSKQLWLLHVDQMTTLTWPAKTWLYNLPKLRFTPSEVKGFILLHQYRWIGLPKLTSIVLLFKRVSDIRRWPEAEMNWFAEATWLASILFLYRQQPARLPFGPCRQNSSLTRTSMPPFSVISSKLLQDMWC